MSKQVKKPPKTLKNLQQLTTNQNCFEKIPEGKGVNLRFILSYIILILLFISALQIAFLNGAAGRPPTLQEMPKP